MIGGAAYTYSTYRSRPMLLDMDEMTPWESFLMWQSLRHGVRLPELAEVPYLEAQRVYHQHLGIGSAIIAVGILISVVSAIAGWKFRPRAARW